MTRTERRIHFKHESVEMVEWAIREECIEPSVVHAQGAEQLGQSRYNLLRFRNLQTKR